MLRADYPHADGIVRISGGEPSLFPVDFCFYVETRYFFWVMLCGNGMFSTFRLRQNDGAGTAGDSLFGRISGIIGTSE